MHKYLLDNKISIKELSQKANIPYSTLNDIVNGKTDINRVRYGYIKTLAKALGLSLEEFDRLFTRKESVKEDYEFTINVKNKSYYLVCENAPKPVYLCKVNELNTFYINTIAKWKYDEIQREKAMFEWNPKKC